MSKVYQIILVALLCTIVSSCSLMQKKQEAAVGEWSFTGKMAVRHQEQGSTLNVKWQQLGDAYTIDLSGSLGLGAIQINGQPGNVILFDGKDSWQSTTLNDLVFQATHLDLPLDYLQYWVRGQPKPNETFESILTEDGYLSSITQAGWTVLFKEYFQDPSSLPRKLSFSKAEDSGKLIIKQWVMQNDDL